MIGLRTFKVLALPVLLFLSPPAGFAQRGGEMTGRIVDSASRAGLEYATVLAADARGKQVGAAISGADGRFVLKNLKKQTYTLHFSMVGYAPAKRQADYDGSSLDLGEIPLAAGVRIGTIVVEPLLRREADRIVYDVGRDPDAGRMKMMEIMKKIPGLEMSPGTGKLKYDDSSLSKILFDGKEESLISTSRQYPMEFIRANVMGTIELILPGSPEYDNNKPILNIKLQRRLPDGIAGEISPQASTRGDYRAGVDLVTKNKAGTIGANYGYGYSQSPRLRSETERTSLLPDAETPLLKSGSENWSYSMSHDLGADFSRRGFADRMIYGISLGTSLRESTGLSTSSNEYFNRSGALDKGEYTRSRNGTYSPMRFNGSVSLQYYPDKKSYSFLWLTYGYTDSREDTRQMSRVYDPDLDLTRDYHTVTLSKQHAANLTWLGMPDKKSGRTGSWSSSLGFVARHYDNLSQYDYWDYSVGDYVQQERPDDGIVYDQYVANAGVSYSNSLFGKKMRYSVTLKAEYVKNSGKYVGEHTDLDYQEVNPLPKVSLNYRSKNYRYGLGYSTRVRRPNVSQLNPFVDDSDPANVSRGNPDLKGEYAHRLYASVSRDLKVDWLRSLSLSYGVEFADKLISRSTSVDERNVALTSWYNMGNSTIQTASLYVSVAPFSALSLGIFGGYTRSDYRFPDRERNVVEGFSLGVTGNVYLKKSRFIEFRYGYAPAGSSVQSKKNYYYSTLDMTVMRYFEKLHMGGQLTVSDLINGKNYVRETIGSPQFEQWSYRQRIGRTFKLSLYWRFGRFKDSDKRSQSDDGVYDMKTPGLLEN